MKKDNPNSYDLNHCKEVEFKLTVRLDMVPGAWHQPEDFFNWFFQHPYIQSVELMEKVK
jgi:hypothetical protein